MPSLWDPNAADEMLARLDRLTPETRARWGRFTCTDMVAHLNESMRMALGDITPASKKTPHSLLSAEAADHLRACRSPRELPPHPS